MDLMDSSRLRARSRPCKRLEALLDWSYSVLWLQSTP
jgi:hypothetical protein